MDTKNQPPIIIFDGVCHLCDWFVQWVLHHERAPVLNFVASQSANGQRLLHSLGMLQTAENSVLLIKDGQVYTKSRAVFAILPYLNLPWRAMLVFRYLPAVLTDKVYDFAARRRYAWFGQRPNCRIPDEQTQHRFFL